MTILNPPKKGDKVITSAYVEEVYQNGVQIYAVYLGTCDPVFVAVLDDKIWGSGEDPLETLYDAAKKWDAKHFPSLGKNPFRQVLESISSPPLHSRTPDYPRDRDDDARHLDPEEKELYGD